MAIFLGSLAVMSLILVGAIYLHVVRHHPPGARPTSNPNYMSKTSTHGQRHRRTHCAAGTFMRWMFTTLWPNLSDWRQKKVKT